MAEIKSSIEIAMERAAALGLTDSGEEAREEGKRQGRGLGRRATSGQRQPGGGRRAPRGPGGGCQGRVNALAVLAAGGPDEVAVVELALMLAQDERLTVDLQASLAEELLAGLAAEGISSNAVHPNPLMQPELQQRYDQAVAELRPR